MAPFWSQDIRKHHDGTGRCASGVSHLMIWGKLKHFMNSIFHHLLYSLLVKYILIDPEHRQWNSWLPYCRYMFFCEATYIVIHHQWYKWLLRRHIRYLTKILITSILYDIMIITSTLPIVGHSDGLVQERRNSSALAMELRLSCTNPSICRPSLAFSF